MSRPILPVALLRPTLSALVFLAVSVGHVLGIEPETSWSMLNVTPAEGQADCHLIRFPDGTNVLIDPADAWDASGTALKQLNQMQVTHLSLVVVSHFHHDHYNRLLDLIQAGIKIDRVVLNVPDKSRADIEIPWGCDWNDVQRVLTELKARNIPFLTPKAGDRIYEVTSPDGTVSGLDVLCLYDGINTPIGPTDVNDTSIIVRLFHGATRALFTGDLNNALGEYLAKSAVDLQADLLKAPHHGTEGAAPNEFYDRVGAKAVLVSAPKKLWESARSMRIRNYFIEHRIPAYVTGIDGNVTVVLRKTGYSIEKSR